MRELAEQAAEVSASSTAQDWEKRREELARTGAARQLKALEEKIKERKASSASLTNLG